MGFKHSNTTVLLPWRMCMANGPLISRVVWSGPSQMVIPSWSLVSWHVELATLRVLRDGGQAQLFSFLFSCINSRELTQTGKCPEGCPEWGSGLPPPPTQPHPSHGLHYFSECSEWTPVEKRPELPYTVVMVCITITDCQKLWCVRKFKHVQCFVFPTRFTMLPRDNLI